ncbi:MAG TPA: M23 family metallopeptidase [Dehalococcoidia bacterium]|nr:M23 family metallopeptidase [Dehalococcoidia bacterium]
MRRALLSMAVLWALLALGSACSQHEVPMSSPQASQPATPTPVPAPPSTPLPTPTPSRPSLLLSPSPTLQGTAVLLRVTPAPDGPLVAEVAGRRIPLVREGDEAVGYLPVPLDQTPGVYAVVLLSDGQTAGQAALEVVDGGYPREQLYLPPSAAGLLQDAAAVQEEARLLAAAHASFTPQRLWRGPWQMPLEGPVSDAFGIYRSINGGPYSPHTGTDLVAPEGTPVLAPATGRVVMARRLHLRGLSVVVDHGAGVVSGYHHLSSLSVQEGQTVQAGQELGRVGSTGLAGGPHLHWELVVHGVRVDPMAWLAALSGA